jgi:hypothetical protein
MRRRSETDRTRGWGPFTGRQLTTIICVGLVTILFPVGAWAVTGSNVFITNASTGAHAAVTSGGALTVTGSVNANQAQPASTFTYFSGASETSGCNRVTPPVPAGKALVVTSVNVAVNAVTTGPVFVVVDAATGASPCGAIESVDESYVAGAKTSEDVQIPSGVVIKPGHAVGVFLQSASGDASAVVHVHGYYVASTLCTVTGPPQGCL